MMKQALLALALLVSPLFASASDDQLYDYFKNLRRGDSLSTAHNNNWIVDSTRNESLITQGMGAQAKTLGVEAGQLYAERQIQHILDASSEYLDELYDVSPYMMTYKGYLVVPAMITEVQGRKTYLNSEKTAFTYADTTYVIQSQPYFVDAPPSWKQYVNFNAKPPVLSSSELLPKTNEEISIWEKAYDEGWKLGVQVAIDNVVYQLTRGLYDLQGMQLYVMLKDAGLVTEPIYSHNNQPVSGTKVKLELGGGAVSIEVLPRMNHDATKFKAIPKLPPLDNLLPRSIYDLLNRIQ